MRLLMTRLAQFSSLSKQGELLCTQGLAYLLESPSASAAFADFIRERVGWSVGADLTWKAEVYEKGAGRCDLEAWADGATVAKLEAKLGAVLGENQLIAYAKALEKCASGLLLVLVPAHRGAEILALVSGMFKLTGGGPWLRGKPDCSVAVIYWEEVLKALDVIRSEPFSGALAQFQAMYRVLKGYDIEPITSDAELLRWREKEKVFVSLVDRVTRRLAQDAGLKVLPMDVEEANKYERRYVCPPLGDENPCFSIGARDPFNGHETPIWMRFYCTTPKFSVIHDRLFASGLSERLLESGGHIWIPLDVPFDTEGEGVIDALVEQAKEIIRVAYQPVT